MATTDEGRWLEAGERHTHDENYDAMLDMLRECKSFIGGVAIADQRGDEWRWELYPRLKALLMRL